MSARHESPAVLAMGDIIGSIHGSQRDFELPPLSLALGVLPLSPNPLALRRRGLLAFLFVGLEPRNQLSFDAADRQASSLELRLQRTFRPES